jgi:hypothetical protein
MFLLYFFKKVEKGNYYSKCERIIYSLRSIIS